MSKWTARDIPDQKGRTFLVTGANSGLGYQTARQLARHGARVVLTARTDAKGRAALDRLKKEQPAADLELRLLDLADLDSVKAFAGRLADDKVTIDVLVNNAGVMMPPRSLTKQGNELQFATNHLGHFALTGLLLESGLTDRVVTVSSGMHRVGSIHFDDLTGERSYSPTSFYAQSKFANILFGLELHRRLQARGSAVKSLMAHPGYAATNLQTSGPKGIAALFGRIGNVVMAQSAEMGALPQLYAATAPQAESGQYIGPDRFFEQRGHPKVVQPVKSAQDPQTARRLWTLSEELTGVTYEI